MSAPRHRVFLSAPCELVQHETGRQWRAECPLCGKHHVHGAGPLSEDPRAYLYHRSDHCLTADKPGPEVLAAMGILNCDTRGYILTDADPRRTEALFGRRRVA